MFNPATLLVMQATDTIAPMPQLLLELFSEEIPARMQKRAAEDLKRLLMDALTKAGFLPGAVATFSAPRRLVAVVEDLPARTPDVREERKGPKVGAPEAAIQGFLRGAGLTDLAQARIVSDPKKGDFHVADIVKPGRATPEAVAEIVPALIREFPWPKSMRWGDGALRWVRPLHRILCLFDGEIVPFSVDGIESGDVSEGHRFHGSGPFRVRDFDDLAAKLSAEHVVLDREERKAAILADARTLAQARNLELVEDEGLAEEVTGLVDEPHVLMGDMDPAFLALPPEVIRLTMRINQKYFAVRDPATGDLAPHFIVVSNIAAEDGGKAIAHGNARVLAARLDDARHFWDLDRKVPLDARVAKLDTIVFHKELGSQGDRVRRIEALTREIAPLVGADPALAARAAHLCKADLVTEMVGEFPELQGVMGRYYAMGNLPSPNARGVGGEVPSPAKPASTGAPDGAAPSPRPLSPAGGEGQAVADAIRDHYRPVGPSDSVPTDPVAVAVALADKLDTLTGFFAIGEKPTGGGDPYALRRAALGVIRIVRENALHISVRERVEAAANILAAQFSEAQEARKREEAARTGAMQASAAGIVSGVDGRPVPPPHVLELLAFILDRLRIALRDEGHAPDVLDAAFAVADDDVNRIVARVEALAGFLATEDGANLTAGIKRASNILSAEEKKAPLPADLAVDAGALTLAAEKSLAAALDALGARLDAAEAARDFPGALAALAALRGPVDGFLDGVFVNDPDPVVRRNRLALLAGVRTASLRIADFSRLTG
jgi:glycyl-tRNA synthetase beta chain